MKKKLLLTFVSVYAATYALLTAASPDLVKGVDFTGSSSVTASKLNQLVDNAYVGPYRGMIIFTNGTPDVSAEAKLARYLWLDSNSSPPVPKVYYTNSSIWTNITAIATIADGSITAAKLASSSVENAKIASDAVTRAKIQDAAVSGAKIDTATITSTNIAAGTIVGANIANATIATTNLIDSSVTVSKLAAQSVGLTNLQSGFLLYGTNIAGGTIGSNHIANAGLNITNLPVNSITAAYIQSGVLPSSTNFTGQSIPAAGGTTTVTHSLPGLPSAVSVVLYCTSNDANTGYVIGDMIPVKFVGDPSGGIDVPEFSYWLTATTVNILRKSTGGTFYLMKKSDGVATAVSSTANFNLRVYLTYTP